MADTVKCACSKCGAKYRLPVEYQGRTAKCKKCGEKFQIPKGSKSVEDSVLDWLSEDPAASDDTTVAQPKVVNMRDTATHTDQASGPQPVVRRKAASG